jgi:hypothetical protein
MNDLDGLRDETLSRLYRESATAQPPSRIDASILAAARTEARLGPERPPQPAWRRWRTAVSFAAVATLAFALSMIVPREMERAEQALPSEAAAPAPVQSAPKPVAPSLERDAAQGPTGLIVPRAPVSSVPTREESASRPAADLGMQSGAAARVPSAKSMERSRAKREDFATEANPWPAAPRAQPSEAQEPEAETRSFEVPQLRRFVGPREPEMPAAAPSPPHAPTADVQAEKKGAGAPFAADAAGNATASPRGAAKAQKQEARERNPAQWLEEIRRLHQQGRKDDASQALAAFRRAYPGYPVPEDLRSLEP